MKATKRLMLRLLITLLVIAFVPLWRMPLVPCHYHWQYAGYAISYSAPGARGRLPDDGFPGFPPLCLDIQRLRRYSI